MKVPKFSRWVTIPVLFILNLLAWLYVYDEYMMGWIIVYPLFMLAAAGFTIAAELAFGRDRKFKYVGLNICFVLLLLVLAQKYLPLDKIETNLQENYYGYLQADVSLDSADRAVRNGGYTIVARNYENISVPPGEISGKLEVYKNGRLLDQITLEDAAAKIRGLTAVRKQGEFQEIRFIDVRYVGVKRKGGALGLIFKKGYVDFRYNLAADGNGFIWDEEHYQVAGLTFPEMDGLYGDETNRRIKDILLKGDKEQLVNIELQIRNDKSSAKEELQRLGYGVISEEPLIIEVPFYEFANLGHLSFIKTLEIK
ncbi:MAG: hypothetical protein ACOWWO_10540 [Peptococcaceae bacterium]